MKKTRNNLRNEIFQYRWQEFASLIQASDEAAIANPGIVRIGERDVYTGKNHVIYPNGSSTINGSKIFEASLQNGTVVRATVAQGVNAIALDSKSATKIQLPIRQVEQEIVLEQSLKDVYITFILDTSGSMNDELPLIKETLEDIKKALAQNLYTDNEERSNKYIQILEIGDERWLDWFSYDFREEENQENTNKLANNILIMAFINESDGGYHSIPRNVSLEPSNAYAEDYSKFIETYEERNFFKGKIFSVDYPPDPQLEASFAGHVTDAMEGSGVYLQLGKGLKEYNCFYQTGFPAGSPKEEYVKQVEEFLGIKIENYKK